MTAGLAGVAVLGLAISFALWWAYFGDGDDERAEQALAAIPGTARTRMACTSTASPTTRCCSASCSSPRA